MHLSSVFLRSFFRRTVFLAGLAVTCSALSSAQAGPKYDLSTESRFKGTIEDLKLPPKGSEKEIAHLTIKNLLKSS